MRKVTTIPPQLSFDFKQASISAVDAHEVLRCSASSVDMKTAESAQVFDLTALLYKRKLDHRQSLYREILDSIQHLS